MLKKNSTKEAEQVKTQLREQYEKHHTFDKLVLVRTIATKSYEFEQIKKVEEAKVQDKIKQIDPTSAAGGGGGFFSSIKGMFGYGKKLTEEEEEEQRKS